MILPEDGLICGPKHVTTIKKTCEQFDWFTYIFYYVDGQLPSIMKHNRTQTLKSITAEVL
jgi:hypothetical protein